MSVGEEHLRDEGSKQQVLIAGGMAGLISRFFIAPLDVVKIRLQLQTRYLNPLKFNTYRALPTIRNILRDEGIRGFWRGNVPAELLYITYGAAQFTTYRSISSNLMPTALPPAVSSFIAGAVAGATATALTYPLDLLRTRFAAQGTSRVYKSLISGFTHIARNEGLRGYYHGLGPGVAQVVPYMGLFFAVYEGLRPEMHNLRLPFGSGDAIAGTLASIITKTGVFPLDLIRKRLQVQGPVRERFAAGQVPEYKNGAWRTGRAIVAKEGWSGLYKGLGISLIKAAPASAITMWSYERALRMMVERCWFA